MLLTVFDISWFATEQLPLLPLLSLGILLHVHLSVSFSSLDVRQYWARDCLNSILTKYIQRTLFPDKITF